jgi:uncharacterized membrane protein (DUF373 family)
MMAVVAYMMERDLSQWFVKGLKAILSLLMGVILLALFGGVLRIGWELRLFWASELEVVLRGVIIHALILLAVVEVFRTLLAYLTEGRVKVTFIVDTVIVVMLTEVISLWFKGGSWGTFGPIVMLLLTLGIMRVFTIRYSPALRPDGRDEGAKT